MPDLLILMSLGALAGLLAGLLGVGGGLVIVPVLAAWLPSKGVPPEQALHAAVATSLASIVFTGAASAYSHYRRGGVDLRSLAWLLPGLLLGSGGGALVIAGVPRVALSLIVAAFCFFAAWQMTRPIGHAGQADRHWLLPSGLGIGVLSTAVGIGGGSLTVPLLHRLGAPLTRAIGTSSAAGIPIALAGTVGYAMATTPAGLSAWAVGLVDLKIAAAIGSISILMAPLGASLAHRWPVARLKRFFAGWLMLVGVALLIRG